jgi:hypothetical protein
LTRASPFRIVFFSNRSIDGLEIFESGNIRRENPLGKGNKKCTPEEVHKLALFYLI